MTTTAAPRRGLARCALWWLLFLLPMLAAAAPATVRITHAEAVRADWDAKTPPVQGWTPVRLPDAWTTRWPTHDGVVWYRLHWTQTDADEPVALLLDYTHMAAAIYVNGGLIARDPSLVEPLSRGWIKARYLLVSAPLLHAGDNELLVRVSGLNRYSPGLGRVMVGTPEDIRRRYDRSQFQRLHIKVINATTSMALGTIFLLMWLLRRRETTFGWFALFELAGALYRYNLIVENPWPFASTDGWQAFVAGAKLISDAAWSVFLLRYAGRRYPRFEQALWLIALATLFLALVAPHWTGERLVTGVNLSSDLLFAGSTGWFMWSVARVPRTDYRVLTACLVIPMLASIYGSISWFGLTPSTHLLRLSQVLTSLGIMFALAYRFVATTRRLEAFNSKLQSEVSAATQQLEATLGREHEMALAKSRADERLRITRDLHDGFGGTLVRAIARLDYAPDETSKPQIVAMLKEMRDDLRLVIDSTGREPAGLADMLAPLRYRSAQLLETANIHSHWHLHGLEGIELDGARSLDLLRLLQEALTNIFKHSRATRVDVSLRREGDRLHLCVADDGTGMGEAAATPLGAGVASMRVRAHRLQGTLDIESGPTGTRLTVSFPLVAHVRPPA